MKITLKNFRCYENSTFEFGNEGVVLLSGPSGSGKTSILAGICFALFGTGTKVVRYGNISCSVILEFDGMTITRTKKPNRLVVDDIYEDDTAQNIINKKFGDTFKTTGYISQNASDSFILMSPIEKLGFLEKFAFQDINLSEIKKRCKDLISERNESLIKTTSQLDMATLMIDELTEPVEVVFPLKCSKNKQESAVENERVKHNNRIILLKRCKQKISSLQKEIHSLEIYTEKIKNKQDCLDSTTEKLDILLKEKESINYIGDVYVKKYEEELSILIYQRELLVLEDIYERDQIRLKNIQEEEIYNMTHNIKSIESNLWNEYTEDEIKTGMIDYKLIIKDLEKLGEYKNIIESYNIDEDKLKNDIQLLTVNKDMLETKKKILDKLEIQKEVFQCPSCDTHLKFNDNNLQVYDFDIITNSGDIDIVSEEISKLKRFIKSLESSISSKQNKLERYKEVKKSINEIENQYEQLPDLTQVKNDIEYLRNYKASQQELYKQVEKLNIQLNGKQYSSSVSSFEKSVNEQKKKIDFIKKKSDGVNIKIDEETVRENITIQKNKKEKLNTVNSRIKILSSEQDDFKNQLDEYKTTHLTMYKSIKNIDDISGVLTDTLSEQSELEKKLALHERNKQEIEKYQEYEKARIAYISWVTKVDILRKEEIENRRLYGAAMLLKEKILEAESIAMLNIISSINIHTEAYLESFFQDNPISVKLVPFKETKNGKTVKIKPQINLQIEYKGMEADLTMLSGGEISRIILAFALALGEMFNTPMILLDECTSSLDQELTGSVMEGIKENFNGKIVILICHQVIEGQFDKVIKIGV
jgi:DNA repair exonuclease SbcCD ATPase subunit